MTLLDGVSKNTTEKYHKEMKTISKQKSLQGYVHEEILCPFLYNFSQTKVIMICLYENRAPETFIIALNENGKAWYIEVK